MKVFLISLIMLLGVSPFSFSQTEPKKEVKKGNSLYNNKEFFKALKYYEQALKKARDSDIVNFNFGTALYKLKRYDESVRHFEKALVSEDEELQQKASYNLGNAKYKYGISKEALDLKATVDLLGQSLRHYTRALEIDPNDEDAQNNYAYVEKELKELRRRLEQQQKNGSSDNQKKENKKESKENRQSQDSQGEKSQEESGKGKQSQDNKQQGEKGQETEDGKGKAEEPQQRKGSGEEGRESKGSGQKEEKAGISEQEALMLLENYQQQEEPQSLYKQRIPTHGLGEPLKDW